jgi:hypothetical protein
MVNLLERRVLMYGKRVPVPPVVGVRDRSHRRALGADLSLDHVDGDMATE